MLTMTSKGQDKLEWGTEQQDVLEKASGPKGTEVTEAAHVPVVYFRHMLEYLVNATSVSLRRETVGTSSKGGNYHEDRMMSAIA